MPENDQNINNCNFSKFEKNKYFYGKLMTVKDFETEQQYFDAKRYLINRLLHGTGIVCGLQNVEIIKKENEPLKINFKDGGMALDCCGHEIVVPSSTLDKIILDEAGSPVSSNSVSSEFYLYLKYKTYYGSYLPVASNSASCEEKCCPGRIIDDFAVVLSNNSPHSAGISCRKDFPLEPVDIKETVKKWLNKLERDNWSCPLCVENEATKVFLASIKSDNNGNFSVDKEATEKYRPAIFRNEELYEIFKCHSVDSNNPHGVTASQVKALESINKVRRDSEGNINLIQKNSIEISPYKDGNYITIGETHSYETNNPHNVTAKQVGALVSVEGVSNPGGNINLIADNSISISAEDTNNSITIGETHSARTDNPHIVTAKQVEALTNINGVFNPGGKVELVVNKGSIEIIPDNILKRIFIGETHSSRTDNPHEVTATQVGALKSLNGINNPGGNIDLIEGMNIKITPNENNNSITLDCTLGLEIQPAETEPKSIGPENLVGTSTMYARADHVHMLENNSVDYNKLSAGLQEQLSILSMYLRERALKCSVSSFKKIAEDFNNERALEIALSFKKAVGKRLYEKENDFIQFLGGMQSPIEVCAEEIREQAEEGCFDDFADSLKALQKTIGEGISLKVAAQQDEVCFYALELKLTVNNPMYKALNCIAVNFRKVADLFKSDIASKISFSFEKAIDNRVYEDGDKFVKFMADYLKLLEQLPEEISLIATEDSINNYILSVRELAHSIESKNALKIADRLQEVCSQAKNLAVNTDPIKSPMYRALKCAVGTYRDVSRKLESDIADTISVEFERAVNQRLYEKENDFIEFMEGSINLLLNLPEEIRDAALEKELNNYIAVANELVTAIESGNALKIAEKQEELCFFAQKLDPANYMYRAFKCTVTSFAEVADIFENRTAKAISETFEKAIDNKLYEEDRDYIKFMKENLEPFETFAKEIKDLATKESLNNYISSVSKLFRAIGSGEALTIAARHEEVCSAARELDIDLHP